MGGSLNPLHYSTSLKPSNLVQGYRLNLTNFHAKLCLFIFEHANENVIKKVLHSHVYFAQTPHDVDACHTSKIGSRTWNVNSFVHKSLEKWVSSEDMQSKELIYRLYETLSISKCTTTVIRIMQVAAKYHAHKCQHRQPQSLNLNIPQCKWQPIVHFVDFTSVYAEICKTIQTIHAQGTLKPDPYDLYNRHWLNYSVIERIIFRVAHAIFPHTENTTIRGWLALW